ncbi:polysaccharide pyruvyl transferase family protein [Luteolibacter pohnpeiensis]|uniref:Polysaccharide pyruvyl transferase family protein n=1 Tax=Luteolibacter pohnpeiensis TaxID=454153 RepID=A0A934S8M2_9BACT|nr:polysaccharide pyruvyl transferase family protein [Luteolibacter pohnpeiensis]MBK1882856.1 polysaccharide pyruvyl transferase family protein [Luteolibacter pohnpeiensis]
MKKIEVLGIGFPNKGAELMLQSVIERLIEVPDNPAALVLQTYHPYKQRIRFKAYQKFWVEKKFFELGRITELMPKTLLSKFGIIKDSDIGVLLDCSGFAYGDQWGYQKANRRLGRNIKRWKKEGKKVILMPQAFGPFKNQQLKDEIGLIIDHADLIFARDPESLKHLQEIRPDAKNVTISADMTIGLTPKPELALPETAGRPCLIPNQKMLEKGGLNEGGYVDFFASIAKELLSRGLNPYLLLHEGPKDLKLCEDIKAKVGANIDVICPEDPVVIKATIGSSLFVVTSRFHGFVSSLSQGVPCVATSWSHKYEMLANEFQIEDAIASISDPSWPAKIADRCADQDYMVEVRAKLKATSQQKKKEVQRMWDKVKSCANL